MFPLDHLIDLKFISDFGHLANQELAIQLLRFCQQFNVQVSRKIANTSEFGMQLCFGVGIGRY